MRNPVRYVNGRPMAAPEDPPSPPVDEFSALDADVDRELEKLEEARQRLAPGALGDDAEAQDEMQNVLSLRRAALEAKENIRLARIEKIRLAAAARERAGAEARAQAMAEAQRLQVERMTAARGVDSGFRKAASALADYQRLCVDQERALSAAGRRGGPASASSIERALARALSDAGLPAGMVDLPPLSGPPKLLSELDPKHVEAVTVTTSLGETEQRSENDG
jgi:hypothetical protein